MFNKVKIVMPLRNYVLLIHFMDGTIKQYDIKPLFDKHDMFLPLNDLALYRAVSVDAGGYGISWNEEIDLSCNELWNNGTPVYSPFQSLISFSDAVNIWNLNESTLRKAVSYGKLIDGIDVKKYGKQWIVTKDAMVREYGYPPNEI